MRGVPAVDVEGFVGLGVTKGLGLGEDLVDSTRITSVDVHGLILRHLG